MFSIFFSFGTTHAHVSQGRAAIEKKKQTNSWHLCGAWFDLDTWADSMISMLFHGFPFFLACRFDPVSVPLSILFFFSCYFFSLILIFLWCFFSWKHVSFLMCFTCFFLELSWFCEGYEVFRSNLVKRIANFFLWIWLLCFFLGPVQPRREHRFW